jgi:hypothetical protein
MEIINDLEFSHRFIASNSFSIPGDKSGKKKSTFEMMIHIARFLIDNELLRLSN